MDYAPYTGKLDTKVQIYRMETVLNALNERVPNETLIADTYACADSEVGTHQVNEKVEHIVTSTFIIRKRSGVISNEELKLVARGISYRVTHVKPIQRSHLKIFCTAYE